MMTDSGAGPVAPPVVPVTPPALLALVDTLLLVAPPTDVDVSVVVTFALLEAVVTLLTVAVPVVVVVVVLGPPTVAV